MPRPTSWSTVCHARNNTSQPDTVGNRHHAFLVGRNSPNEAAPLSGLGNANTSGHASPAYSGETSTAKADRCSPESLPQEWRTVIVGLPIIRKLLNAEEVNLETFKVSLISDDVLWNNQPKRAGLAASPAEAEEGK